MNARKPIQFSIAGLLVLTTSYAVLFSLLRTVQAPPWEFAFWSLFVTTVLYGQWALFDSKRPYFPSMVVCSGLCAITAVFLALGGVPHCGHDLAQAIGIAISAFPIGLFIGVAIGGAVDIGTILCEICLHRQPVLGPLFKSKRDAEETTPARWYEGRAARLIGLSFLVFLTVKVQFWL